VTGALVVSVHDIAAATADAGRGWSEHLDRLGVPATLLVVAGPFGGPRLDSAPADLVRWLRDRAAMGDEIALHGWTHRADTPGPAWRRVSGGVIARGAGEFWGLTRREAAERLGSGIAVMERAGLPVSGFTPPGWLASRGTVEAAGAAGLRYVTSHLWVTDLMTGRRIAAPAVCHRPDGRLQGAGTRIVRRLVPALVRRHRVVRLGLHPADLAHPALVGAALDAIAEALAAGARPMTYLELLDTSISVEAA
jgi:predicted deacetylase